MGRAKTLRNPWRPLRYKIGKARSRAWHSVWKQIPTRTWMRATPMEDGIETQIGVQLRDQVNEAMHG